MEWSFDEIVQRLGQLLAELVTPAIYYQIAVLLVAALGTWLLGRVGGNLLRRRLLESTSVGVRRFA